MDAVTPPVGAKYSPEMEHGVSEVVQQASADLARRHPLDPAGAVVGDAVSVLTTLAETSLPSTARHQIRVGQLARRIAIQLDLDEAAAEPIRLAGESHDVGKLAYPAEFRVRHGRLNPDEHLLVKEHPWAGYDILVKLGVAHPIPDVALQHHERLDGSGYPQGLSGDEIALSTLIVTVADVIEALTQDRSYHDAISIGEALVLLRDRAGVLYHPDVVDACLSVFAQGFEFANVSH